MIFYNFFFADFWPLFSNHWPYCRYWVHRLTIFFLWLILFQWFDETMVVPMQDTVRRYWVSRKSPVPVPSSTSDANRGSWTNPQSTFLADSRPSQHPSSVLRVYLPPAADAAQHPRVRGDLLLPPAPSCSLLFPTIPSCSLLFPPVPSCSLLQPLRNYATTVMPFLRTAKL